jgi:hypothetical protein
MEKSGANSSGHLRRLHTWERTEGSPTPLGATWVEAEEAWNFALYSRGATGVTLLLHGAKDFVKVPNKNRQSTMNTMLFKLLRTTLAGGMVMFMCSPPASAQEVAYSAGTPPLVPAEELPAGSQVLARGQVHEAFAKPVTMDPQAPVLVPKQPPEALQEMPPAERPAGADIVWVPGYWGWDEDRNDFIWVSGCWRNAPPKTYWVPGHWLQADNGWQWVAGFWKPIAAQPQEQIEYLPAPPVAVEIEAPGRPPLPDQVWVPGCWYWSEGRYVRRHGYWITQQAGWVWVPSHYVWTPRGYIFCPGHWDYDLDSRGVLFTPAYFPPEVRVRVGFVFCPTVCVDLGMLRLNLFAYPRYHHYCFGDYYDDAYLRVGIYPWFRCQTVHTWYDPLFVYDSWRFGRSEPRWARRQAQEFQMRRANRDLRPARTYAELQVQMDHMPAAKRPERPLVQPVRTFAGSQSTPVKFERITPAERQQLAVKSTEVRALRDQRTHWESPVPQPASTASPLTRQQPPTQPEPARVTAAGQRVARPATTPATQARGARSVPRPEVRVTHPEQVLVPSPAFTPKPSEPRYIEKQAPGRPAQEHYRTDATPNTKSPGKDPRGKSQPNDPQRKDRQR